MTNRSAKFLGVLMLDTQFPRPPGDVGNEETFLRHGIPVRFTVIRGASPQRIVKEADPALLQPFVDAARQFVAEGAAMITTSCGFLASYQDVLAAAVPVPVLTSSLLACRQFVHPGIVTFDAASLTPGILAAAGVPASTPVQGVEPGCEFHRRILNNEQQLDLDEASRNVVEAACHLVAHHPSVEDIVLECTNMPPYRDAVAQATGRRVHDIETLIVAQWRAQVAQAIQGG
ncbi:aspartate/glutamate racemase family protein [Pigmentiphaga aceris]|uniref:Aspartate/glutamate racemase family protein n=1 Tax=Pigmentiphaga aceris TaxID=1940612 RepID=A0A5C0B580_9BURK|nr:aspartate/glutamate racemase family protein [Pigmentiphaga aceris]QEI08813.1 aspartate/glutamate racemase family protein [Pigmentiphaga aceris]